MCYAKIISTNDEILTIIRKKSALMMWGMLNVFMIESNALPLVPSTVADEMLLLKLLA